MPSSSARIRRPAAGEKAASLPAGAPPDGDPPSRGELAFVLALLFVLCALPFLLGDQPTSLLSAEEMGLKSPGGDSRKQFVLMGFYALTGLLLLRRLDERAREAIGLFLPALLVWILASAVWSDLPGVTLRRTVALTGTVLFGIYLALRLPPSQLAQTLVLLAVPVLGGSLLVALAMPAAGLDPEGRLRGLFSHKNSIASFSALAIMSAAVMLIEPRASSAGEPARAEAAARRLSARALLPWAVIVLGTASFVWASSMTPIPATLLSLAVLLGLGRRSRTGPDRLTVGICVTLGVWMILLPWMAPALGEVAVLMGRDANFSGRTAVWSFSIEFIQRQPLQGFGYSSFWTGPAGLVFFRWARFPAPHAHNGVLQLLLDCGLIGFLLMAVLVAGLLFKLQRMILARGEGRVLWIAGFLVLYFLLNLTEAHLLDPNDLYTVFFAYSVVRMNIEGRLHGAAEAGHRLKTRRQSHRLV